MLGSKASHKVFHFEIPDQGSFTIAEYKDRLGTKELTQLGVETIGKNVFCHTDASLGGVVLKRSPPAADDEDRFMAAVSEALIQTYLSRQLTERWVTPHLPFAFFSVVNQKQELILVMDFVGRESVYKFFKNQIKSKLDPPSLVELVRLVLFQVTYTLAWIQHFQPRFLHNDLHCGNVMIRETEGRPNSCYDCYTSPDGQKYYIPDRGVKATIIDFNWSTIPGFVDNLCSVDAVNQKKSETDLICKDHNPGWDLRRFVHELAEFIGKSRSRAAAVFCEQLCEIWGMGILGDATFTKQKIFPSPTEVLRSPLFACYRECPQPAFVPLAYGSNVHPLSEFELAQIREEIVLPEGCSSVFQITPGFGMPGTDRLRGSYSFQFYTTQYEKFFGKCVLAPRHTSFPQSEITETLQELQCNTETIDAVQTALRKLFDLLDGLPQKELPLLVAICSVVLMPRETEVDYEEIVANKLQHRWSNYEIILWAVHMRILLSIA